LSFYHFSPMEGKKKKEKREENTNRSPPSSHALAGWGDKKKKEGRPSHPQCGRKGNTAEKRKGKKSRRVATNRKVVRETEVTPHVARCARRNRGEKGKKKKKEEATAT